MKSIAVRRTKQKEGATQQSEAQLAEAARQFAENKRDAVVDAVQERYGQVKEKAQEVGETLTSKRDDAIEQMDYRLNEYNSKIDEAADNLPGDLKQKIMRYPWVTLVSALGLGAIIGFWLKPRR